MRVTANPAVIAWARRGRHLPAAVAAERMGVPETRLRAWEDGTEHPTLNQLRRAAQIYKRPLAVFYLPEPPEDLEKLPDMRRRFHLVLEHGGEVDVGSTSPELWLAVRHCHYLRERAREIWGSVGASSAFTLRISETDPTRAAAQVRSHLSVTLESQRESQNDHAALRLWRDALAQAGVLVFQFSGVDVDEARGFSLADDELPVIALNSADAPTARIFTAVHELVHLAIRRAQHVDTEVFCNAVAGRTLVPAEALRDAISSRTRRADWTGDELGSLAREFAVSAEVVARRLADEGLMPQSDYHAWHLRLSKRVSAAKGDGGPTFYLKRLSELGHVFVQRVFQAFDQEAISVVSAARVLGVRPDQLDRLWQELA